MTIERGPNSAYPAIHHVARSDNIRPGSGVADRGLHQQLDGSVVQHVVMISFLGDDAAMSVRGVFAKADICDHDQIRCRLFDRANCLLHDSVLRVGLGCAFIFLLGNAEQQNGGNAELSDGLTFIFQAAQGKLSDARHTRYIGSG